MIIHLNGWPGVGKKTIGRVLARRLSARFIHNHLLHDVAIVCHGLDDPKRWVLYEEVRRAAYRGLRERPSAEIFVMTNALCTGAPREREAWSHVVDLAIDRRVPLIPVVLEASLAENERRLQDSERQGCKMTDPALLREFITTDKIQRPDVPELLVLDVTRLAPEAASETILHHVALQPRAAASAAAHRLR